MTITVPGTPLDLGLAGFPEWRTHQREAVQDIIEAFQDVKVVLVEAPTGSGKTIIGAGVARSLGGPAMYLSHTLMLQDQQLHTLPDAVTVTGRRNHPCLQPVAALMGLMADEADCPCPLAVPAEDGGCSYYAQWFRAMGAPDVVLNYAYMVRIVKAHGIKVAAGYGDMGQQQDVISNPFTGRRLMVCDEGHNLEAALLDADKVEIYSSSFRRYGYTTPATVQFEEWPAWADSIANDLSVRYATLRQARSAALRDGSLTADAFRDSAKLKALLTTVQSIQDLRKRSEHTPFVVGHTPQGYTIQPLWAWDRSYHLLFNYADNVMVMSATLGDPALLARLLGLETWTHLRIPSTFPVQNRPVFYWPVSRMKYNMDEADKQRQVAALIHLARKFSGSPGVVHCNSYALGRYLVDSLRRYDAPDVEARIQTHTATDREKVFTAFERSGGLDNGILVTPAATTGVDWDFLGWQMIPKVPYPDLSDDIVKLRYDYVTEEGESIGKVVYQHEAAKVIVQAAGRCVRTPTSRGVTIVTDAAFWPLYKHIAPKAFPDWFRAAVQWYDPSTPTPVRNG